MAKPINQRVSPEIILDSMFLLPKMTGNVTMLNLPGMRGYISHIRDPYANRVGLTSSTAIGEKIQQVCDFFADRKMGFTWVTGPSDIDAGIPEKLLAFGLKPAHFHQIAGMCLKAPFPEFPKNPDIRIQEIQHEEIISHIALISSVYGLSQEMARYLYVSSQFQQSIRSRFYLAYLKNIDEPVGYSSSAYVADDSIVVLRGSGIIPKHRGKGIYKALIQQRLADAIDDGLYSAIVCAARDSSCHALNRFGFQENCPIEWYQWSPEALDPHTSQ